jgi:hypothetical protein
MKIVHPTDFSDCAEQAPALAVELARALGAELILLHGAVEAPLFREGLTRAHELEHFFDEQREWARRTLEERRPRPGGKASPPSPASSPARRTRRLWRQPSGRAPRSSSWVPMVAARSSASFSAAWPTGSSGPPRARW